MSTQPPSQPPTQGPTQPPGTPAPHRGTGRFRLLTIIAVVALIAGVVLLVVRANRTTSGSGSARSASATATGTASRSAVPTSPSATAAPSPTRTTSATSVNPPSSGTGVPLLDQGYVPLYPFVGLDDANAWQQSYRQGGHQPWHLSAGETALSFTRGYLGFTDVDRVVGPVRTDPDGAHVDVGYLNPANRLFVAATLHLMRLGVGALAPWEVVGSDDTTFTLDIPSYGSTVTSPLRVGGVITGVDENIVVSLHQLGREAPLATAPGVPAGGDRQPWSVAVSFTGARSGAMTVAAFTGGHLQRVERFAITGARVR